MSSKSLSIDALNGIPCDPAKKLDILKIARILIETYSAKKVILFGSQANGNWKENSDIDFLVIRSSDIKNVTVGDERILTYREQILSPYDVVTIAEEKVEECLKDQASVIAGAFANGAVIYG